MSKTQTAVIGVLVVLALAVFCLLAYAITTTLKDANRSAVVQQVTPAIPAPTNTRPPDWTPTAQPTATSVPTWPPTPTSTYTPIPTPTSIPTPTPIPFDPSNLEDSYCEIAQNHLGNRETTEWYCRIWEILPSGRVLLTVDMMFPTGSIDFSDVLSLHMLIYKALFTSPVAPGAVDIFVRIGDNPLDCVISSGIGYKTQADFDWSSVEHPLTMVDLWTQLRTLDNRQDISGSDQEWLGWAETYPPVGCP